MGIQRLLPTYRLQQLAKRLTGQYPDPPRPVPTSDVLSAYGPVFAYAAVAIVLVLILTVAFRHAQVNQSLLALGAVMVLGYGFLAVFLVSNVAKALRTGILVDGEVIAGPKLRVSIKGQTRDIVLNARRTYPTGARLNVMIDPAKQTVLLLLGSAP